MISTFHVWGVHTITEYPPIALGMCMSYAQEALADNEAVEFSPRLVSTERQLAELLCGDTSSPRNVLLFSNYIWNLSANLYLSRLAKILDPTCITIHGGPDTPAYPEASRAFLTREPHVDFIVAGEGEETLKELLSALVTQDARDIDVAGLRYLREGTLVATPPRARAVDVNKFPSPYLGGFFRNDDLMRWQSATIETNRGCPYGCVFCDWGSNTTSKVRHFDLVRVFAEIEWVAEHKVEVLWIADANFGMFDRDVEIIRKVCGARRRFGFPTALVLTFAKNIKTRVTEIVQMMVEADLIGTGIVSLQTMDTQTLKISRRSNIKPTEYEKLRNAFAARNLPLNVELMMGLPGSTLEAFKRDLAYHFDRPIEVSVNRTIMLPNSPMADEDYRREHSIEVDDQRLVVQTATMTAEEIEAATVMCRLFYGVHRYGVLRYLVRWLEWERGVGPLDIIEHLVREPGTQEAYPLLQALVADAHVGTAYDLATAIASFREDLRRRSAWEHLSEQFVSWASVRYDFVVDDALRELAQIQARVMPSAGRRFPEAIETTHDVAHWYADWYVGRGRALSSYGPGMLEVRDPYEISDRVCAEVASLLPGNLWELDFEMLRIRWEREA